eukprot:547508_1
MKSLTAVISFISNVFFQLTGHHPSQTTTATSFLRIEQFKNQIIKMNKNNHKSTKSPDANVKIFESNPSGNCDDNDKHKGNINCVAVKRISVGLKYYDALFSNKSNIKMTEEETKEMFVHFNETVYGRKQLLDDSIHIIKQHNGSQQLIDMQNELKTNYN